MELLTVALPPGPLCSHCGEILDQSSPLCINCGTHADFIDWYDWFMSCHEVMIEFQARFNVCVYESINSEGPYWTAEARKKQYCVQQPVVMKLKTSSVYGNLVPIASNKGK